MRTLLISATLLALAGATPVLAQSYAHAISPYEDQRDGRYDPRQDGRDSRQAYDPRGQAHEGGGARPGYQNSSSGRDAYGDQGAYWRDDHRRARRHHHRQAGVISRYAGFGNPVYYDDGMIRTGRDWPAGTVGLAHGVQARPQVCTVRRSYYDAHQDRYRVTRRRVPCAGQARYEEE